LADEYPIEKEKDTIAIEFSCGTHQKYCIEDLHLDVECARRKLSLSSTRVDTKKHFVCKTENGRITTALLMS